MNKEERIKLAKQNVREIELLKLSYSISGNFLLFDEPKQVPTELLVNCVTVSGETCNLLKEAGTGAIQED